MWRACSPGGTAVRSRLTRTPLGLTVSVASPTSLPFASLSTAEAVSTASAGEANARAAAVKATNRRVLRRITQLLTRESDPIIHVEDDAVLVAAIGLQAREAGAGTILDGESTQAKRAHVVAAGQL